MKYSKLIEIENRIVITRGQGEKEKGKHLLNAYKVTARKQEHVLEFYYTVIILNNKHRVL